MPGDQIATDAAEQLDGYQTEANGNEEEWLVDLVACGSDDATWTATLTTSLELHIFHLPIAVIDRGFDQFDSIFFLQK